MKTKICTKCKHKLLATREFFYLHKGGKNGLRPDCKICHLRVCKKYHHREEIKEHDRKKHKLYYQQHLEQVKRIQKQYASTIIGHLRKVYGHIKERCNNPKCKCYKNYGARGIKNLFASSDGFVDYIIDELQIDPRGLEIDRIDNNGHYEKGNVRFVTCKENNNNKRNGGKWLRV